MTFDQWYKSEHGRLEPKLIWIAAQLAMQERASQELEQAFAECDTLNLLHGAARIRGLPVDDSLAQARSEKDAEIASLRKHYDAAGPEHNLLDLLDLYDQRRRDAEQDAKDLRADLKAVVEAIETCLGRRGAFSCAPRHDCRCDKDRGISDICVCGADDLELTLSRPGVRAVSEGI